MIDRRHFLHTSALAATAAFTPPPLFAAEEDRWGKTLPRRLLGSTGIKTTLFGVGGAHVIQGSEEQVEARIDRAIELGCRYFDTAEGYRNGKSEELFGKFLCPKYRDEILLISKSRAETGKEMRHAVEQSLRRMKIDFIDVYFLHWILSKDDLDKRLSGGVHDEMLKLKDEGKIKHLGFSCHSDPVAATDLIERNLAGMEVCLLALNVADPHYHSFITGTLPAAQKSNYGILAMKVLAGGGLFGGAAPWGRIAGKERPAQIPEKLSVREAQHFALSLPITAFVSGVTSMKELEENIANTAAFTGMTAAERKALQDKVAQAAKNGQLEHYKFA